MKSYFNLQFTLFNRRIKDREMTPITGYIIVVSLFSIVSILIFNFFPFSSYAYVVLAIYIIGKLSEIKRNDFLSLCFKEKKLISIRITENLLCTFPFVFFLCVKGEFINAFILIVISIILALFKYKSTINFTIWTPFSSKPFEFPTGFRKNFLVILGIYLLAGIAIYVQNFNLSLFCLILVFLNTLSYYSMLENDFFVWIHNLNPSAFLIRKIKTALIYSTLLASPIILALTIFYLQNWTYILFCIAYGYTILTSLIVTKYSSYPYPIPIQKSLVLGFACILAPPFLFILIPYHFGKAKSELNSLLK